MGIKAIKQNLANSYEMARLSGKMLPQLKKIAKKMGEERVYQALTDDAEMEVFAREVHEQFTPDIQAKVQVEQLIPLIMQSKKHLMKKKSNQKKVAKRKK